MKRKPGKTSSHNSRARKTHKKNLWTSGRGGTRL